MENNRELEVVTQRICVFCQDEVPLSEALVPEAADYMVYFCGLDCYAAWRTRAAASYALSR